MNLEIPTPYEPRKWRLADVVLFFAVYIIGWALGRLIKRALHLPNYGFISTLIAMLALVFAIAWLPLRAIRNRASGGRLANGVLRRLLERSVTAFAVGLAGGLLLH
jgi:hypothetical protein